MFTNGDCRIEKIIYISNKKDIEQGILNIKEKCPHSSNYDFLSEKIG